jgi:hypothetical protein
MAKDIDYFIYDFKAIDDPDYGDFMRKANYLLIELDEKIYDSSTKEVRQILDKMKDEIQFHPNWEKESTREDILNLAKKVKQLEERTNL